MISFRVPADWITGRWVNTLVSAIFERGVRTFASCRPFASCLDCSSFDSIGILIDGRPFFRPRHFETLPLRPLDYLARLRNRTVLEHLPESEFRSGPCRRGRRSLRAHQQREPFRELREAVREARSICSQATLDVILRRAGEVARHHLLLGEL